jgi:hypothetical protein
MWKIDSIVKCILKYKHDHVYTHIEDMFTTVGLFEGTKGGGRVKKNDRECIMVKYTASVQKNSIMRCIESC